MFMKTGDSVIGEVFCSCGEKLCKCAADCPKCGKKLVPVDLNNDLVEETPAKNAN
jgi:hypothetical protein